MLFLRNVNVEEKKRKHILMLLSNPATNDPRPIAEAKTLANSGFTITIFAWDRNGKLPKQTLLSNNLMIRRFRLKTPYGQNPQTLLGFAFFYVWCLVNSLAIKFQAVHCHDIDTLPCGILLKTFRNKKLRIIYDMHDHPSVFLGSFPKSSLLINLSFVFIKRWVNHLIVVNEGFVDYLVSKGFERGTITVIMNTFTVTVDRPESKHRNSYKVVYCGPLTKARGVQTLIQAFQQLPDINLVLAGKGDLIPWINEMQKLHSNIRCLGWISLNEISELTKEADLIVCLSSANLKYKINHLLASPGKFFTAIANRIPVLVPSGTFVAEITKKYNCGLVVDMADPTSIRNGLITLRADRHLYDTMAGNGLKIAQTKFNWSIMKQRLCQLYSEVLVNA